MGKLFILLSAFQAGARALLAVAALGVVVSIYYYFGWIKAAFFETWTPPAGESSGPARPSRTPVAPFAAFVLGALALASIVFGFYPGPLGDLLTLR
jgi:NADH-quinone oxidoreductase subunit N